MATVELDVLPGSIRQTPEGFELDRVCRIKGVVGAANARLYNALTDPGVPAVGDSHPVVPNAFVIDKSGVPHAGDDPSIFDLVIRYRYPEPIDLPPQDVNPGVIETGGGLTGVRTNVDVAATPITVQYTFPSSYEDPQFAGTTQTQGGEVDVQVPLQVFRETRREAGPPTAKSRANVGKTNLFAIWGGAIGTYLCTRIEGNSADGGQTWMVTYEFQYRPEGWTTSVVFKDPKTNKPIPDPDANSLKDVTLYEQVDFGPLNLNLT